MYTIRLDKQTLEFIVNAFQKTPVVGEQEAQMLVQITKGLRDLLATPIEQQTEEKKEEKKEEPKEEKKSKKKINV